MQSRSPLYTPKAVLIHTAAFLALLIGLYLTSRVSYLLFHTLAEFFRMSVDLAVFIVVLNARDRMDNGYLLFLGPAFLSAAVFTVLHTLAYKGMGIFPGYGADLPTQLWIASRYVMALSFVLAPLFTTRRPSFFAVLGVYMAATALVTAMIFLRVFPCCYLEDLGLTPFKIYSEYAICLLFALAAALVWRQRAHFDRPVLGLILLGIIFTMAAELAFTFYISVYGLSNLLGHFFITVSTYFMYRAIVVTGIRQPHELLFRELSLLSSRLRRTIDLVPHMIYARDLDGRFVLVNRATAEAFGTQVKDLRGKLLTEVHPHGEEVRAALTEDGRIIRGEAERSEAEETFTPARGPQRILKTSRIAFDRGAEARPAALAVSVDVTKERRDQALREDIERITRHDLRSPLSGMVGLPQLLASQGNLTEEQQGIVDMIQEAGRRMLEMINNSLNLYKLETGDYELAPQEVDPAEVARRAARDLAGLCEAYEARLVVEAGEGLTVMAEAELLYRLLANLMANAVEASPCGGTVLVRVDPARRTVSVMNAGAVPREIRDRFFEKNATFGKKKGTGLGTYSALLIAKAHGWDIFMRTSEQEGTTVEVRFN